MKSIQTLDALKEGEVALLSVDPSTGVPLNEAGEWVKKGEELYLPFSSEDEARAFAHTELKKNPYAEWSLLDALGNQIDVLHDQVSLIEQSRSVKKGFWSKLFK